MTKTQISGIDYVQNAIVFIILGASWVVPNAIAASPIYNCRETPDTCQKFVDAAQSNYNHVLDSTSAIRLLAIAFAISIGVKILVSAIRASSEFYLTKLGKIYLRIGILISGVVVMCLGCSFGVPWWQSLIVACGAPASIIVHEIMKTVPYLRRYVEESGEPISSKPGHIKKVIS